MALYYDSASHFDKDGLGPEKLSQLIASGYNLQLADRQGMTLLHHACFHGHGHAVAMLVKAGVAIEAQDREGRTPLHLACLMAGPLGKGRARGKDHVNISTYLQEQGAVTSTQDCYGHTPLSYLPQEAKSLGLGIESVDGGAAVWAEEVVTSGSCVLAGSVAQASVIQMRGQMIQM